MSISASNLDPLGDKLWEEEGRRRELGKETEEQRTGEREGEREIVMKSCGVRGV